MLQVAQQLNIGGYVLNLKFHINQNSALKKSGYRLKNPNNEYKEEPATKAKAEYYQPEENYSDLDCGVINDIKDYHTPTGLVDHDYIWQSKQQEVAEINSKGSATAEATTHYLLSFKDTTHNIQPKIEAIYKVIL
jgi:hypothetical protein